MCIPHLSFLIARFILVDSMVFYNAQVALAGLSKARSKNERISSVLDVETPTSAVSRPHYVHQILVSDLDFRHTTFVRARGR